MPPGKLKANRAVLAYSLSKLLGLKSLPLHSAVRRNLERRDS
jgi:hypothetical protein